MPELWEDAPGGLIFVEGDPGVPSDQINNPLAGLPADVCGQLTSLLTEAKAIGTAQLSANVLSRDVPLRFQPPAMVRSRMREAATNVHRDMKQIVQDTARAIRPMLERVISGEDVEEVREATAREWARAYERVRDVGRAASAIHRHADATVFREEEEWFRSAVREELKYWNTFLDEVARGDVPDARARARFRDYLKALRFMYEGARIQGVPDNVLLYWMGPRDERRCPGCVFLTERSPFTKDNIPAVPRDGTTRCLTHCRHRIVVRVASSIADVQRRRGALPKREAMLRELREVQDRDRRTHSRPGGAAQNPFRGRPIQAPPPRLAPARGFVPYPGRPGFRIGESLADVMEAALDELEEVSFTAATPVAWSGEVATFKVDDSEYRVVMRGPPWFREVMFQARVGDGSWTLGLTGLGNPIRVLSSVVGAIVEYLKHNPMTRALMFTAKGGSRAKVYARMLSIFTKQQGWRYTEKVDADSGVFIVAADDATMGKAQHAAAPKLIPSLMVKKQEKQIATLQQRTATLRDRSANEDEVGPDPELASAAKRAGFPDLETARRTVQMSRDLKKVEELPPRLVKKLTRPEGETKVIAESTPQFDTVAYANMRLVDVAALLNGAVSGTTLNRAAIEKLVERLIVALEYGHLASAGRAETTRFSNSLRDSLTKLLARAEVNESTDRLIERVMHLRGLVETRRTVDVLDLPKDNPHVCAVCGSRATKRCVIRTETPSGERKVARDLCDEHAAVWAKKQGIS
jgi:hypothetical protein